MDPVSGEVLPQQIAVLGLGYVGCVTAACLAHLGHRVVGVDRDQFKVDTVRAGSAPFFEPGLEELVRDSVNAGRLTASVSLSEALADADVALICVGTPSEKNGNLGLDQLRRVSQEIAASLPGRTKPLVVAVRSTVYPGNLRRGRAAADGRLAAGYPWSPTPSSSARARPFATSWNPRCW